MEQDTTCPYCNERPLGKRKNARTCGDKACQRARNYETFSREKDREHKRKVRAADPDYGKVWLSCPVCGDRAMVHPGSTYCSTSCGNLARAGVDAREFQMRRAAQEESRRRRRIERERRDASRACTHCGGSMDGRPKSWKTCCLECREARGGNALGISPLRRAYNARSYGDWRTALLERCSIDDAGCWNWSGAFGKDKYPKASGMALHRASLEMRLGRGLGVESAHHICANPRCVNPDHLQPISNRENVAEMMQRRYYIARIEELEAEVRRLDPASEVLTENLPMTA